MSSVLHTVRGDLVRLYWRVVRPPLRDPLNAAMLFALGCAYHLSGLHGLIWGEGRLTAPAWQHLGLLSIACGADVFRARAPRASLRIGLGAFAASLWIGTTLPMVLVMCDLLYASVLYGSRRRSRILPAIVVVLGIAAAVTAVIVVRDWRSALAVIIGFISVPLVPVLWALQVRFHRELAETERARAEQVARLAELDRWAAVTAERGRMARDLHDVVAGHLSAIAVQSEAVLSMTKAPRSGDERAAVNGALRSVRENSVQALTEMRAMIGLLRGTEPEPRLSPPRLRELRPLLESAEAAGNAVEVESDPRKLPDLPAAVDLTAYRIVQEALTNTVRHAPGSTVALDVRHTDDAVVVDISNPLPKGRPEPGGGTGLTSMAERAHLVGGVLSAGPDGGHWRVRARLPLDLAGTEAT